MDSIKRFSDVVENYAKFRPHYPLEIISFLKKETGLNSTSFVADIGSGTGISSKIFLENGNTVFAVEPNDKMREFAERNSHEYEKFHSIKGTAENTTMENSSVNFIVCAQAFHWFDVEKARTEAERILRKNGYVILMWNERKTNSDFLKAYDDLLLKVSDDYENINHTNITNSSAALFEKFYGKGNYNFKIFYNEQITGWNGFLGRTLSCSYVPDENHQNYSVMMNGLKEIFEKFNKNGKIKFEYDTKVYFGRLML